MHTSFTIQKLIAYNLPFTYIIKIKHQFAFQQNLHLAVGHINENYYFSGKLTKP